MVCIDSHRSLSYLIFLLTISSRRLFIIEGSVSGFVAITGFWLLPNTPLTTRWLSQEEREIAHARIERDKMGEPEQASMMEGLRQAVRDRRTWVFCLMQNFHLSACCFNSFFPTYVFILPNFSHRRPSTIPKANRQSSKQCREDSWLQYNRHLSLDLPAVHLCRRRWYSCRPQFRKTPRANLAYHSRSHHGYNWIRNCGFNAKHRRPIYCLLYIPDRCILS